TPNDEPSFMPGAAAPGTIMFKRRAAGHHRIFPSQPAAPPMAPAPAPMTTSDSIPADLGYLHLVSDDELEAYEKGCHPPPIQPPAPPGFTAAGYMIPPIELAAVN